MDLFLSMGTNRGGEQNLSTTSRRERMASSSMAYTLPAPSVLSRACDDFGLASSFSELFPLVCIDRTIPHFTFRRLGNSFLGQQKRSMSASTSSSRRLPRRHSMYSLSTPTMSRITGLFSSYEPEPPLPRSVGRTYSPHSRRVRSLFPTFPNSSSAIFVSCVECVFPCGIPERWFRWGHFLAVVSLLCIFVHTFDWLA